jgi:hypothetical protein
MAYHNLLVSMLIAERILLFAVTKYKIFYMKYTLVYEQLNAV